jgi:NAD(P)-dependent dehydrogenase (short-subunit alcohol dehydrogenase family)
MEFARVSTGLLAATVWFFFINQEPLLLKVQNNHFLTLHEVLFNIVITTVNRYFSYYVWGQYLKKSKYGMKGKVCLVTGANSGIGRATALGLAKMGATVVMVCRNQTKCEAARAKIVAASGNGSVDLMIADLSSQRSICQLATDFKDRYQQLHVLVNNAGTYLSRRQLTGEGIEAQFAVNHLAYFFLTNLLIDVLKASAPARIVNITSAAHSRTIDFENLQGEKQYDGFWAYRQSKLANILFTYELARKLRGTGITVNCAHPGTVQTGLLRQMPSGVLGSGFRKVFNDLKLFFMSPEKGAETSIYLASSPEVEGVSGKYFAKKKVTQSSPVSYDRLAALRLWKISTQLTLNAINQNIMNL